VRHYVPFSVRGVSTTLIINPFVFMLIMLPHGFPLESSPPKISVFPIPSQNRCSTPTLALSDGSPNVSPTFPPFPRRFPQCSLRIRSLFSAVEANHNPLTWLSGMSSCSCLLFLNFLRCHVRHVSVPWNWIHYFIGSTPALGQNEKLERSDTHYSRL